MGNRKLNKQQVLEGLASEVAHLRTGGTLLANVADMFIFFIAEFGDAGLLEVASPEVKAEVLKQLQKHSGLESVMVYIAHTSCDAIDISEQYRKANAAVAAQLAVPLDAPAAAARRQGRE